MGANSDTRTITKDGIMYCRGNRLMWTKKTRKYRRHPTHAARLGLVKKTDIRKLHGMCGGWTGGRKGSREEECKDKKPRGKEGGRREGRRVKDRMGGRGRDGERKEGKEDRKEAGTLKTNVMKNIMLGPDKLVILGQCCLERC